MVTCHICNVSVGKATITCQSAVTCHNCNNLIRGHPLITSRRGGGGGYTDLVTVSDGKTWGGGGGWGGVFS